MHFYLFCKNITSNCITSNIKESDAKQVIEQALNQAFLKGAFSLQDAAMITQALGVLFTEPQLVQEN
jgi:hypothetical protein